MLPFFDKKFEVLWTNSNEIAFWVIEIPEGVDSVFALDVAQKVNLIDFGMMLLATIACVTGSVLAFLKDVKPTVFFSLLSFFAFNLMEIVFEVQPRYRTVVMHLFVFFVCWACQAPILYTNDK